MATSSLLAGSQTDPAVWPVSCRDAGHPPAGGARIQATDLQSVALMRRGCLESATFRAIVLAIERAHGVVYVGSSVGLSAGLEGSLLHRLVRTPDGLRCLWIVVRSDRASPYRVSVLAHELQHALEVLEHPDIADSAGVARLYAGHARTPGGRVAETDAAQAAGAAVLRELRQ